MVSLTQTESKSGYRDARKYRCLVERPLCHETALNLDVFKPIIYNNCNDHILVFHIAKRHPPISGFLCGEARDLLVDSVPSATQGSAGGTDLALEHPYFVVETSAAPFICDTQLPSQWQTRFPCCCCCSPSSS